MDLLDVGGMQAWAARELTLACLPGLPHVAVAQTTSLQRYKRYRQDLYLATDRSSLSPGRPALAGLSDFAWTSNLPTCRETKQADSERLRSLAKLAVPFRWHLRQAERRNPSSGSGQRGSEDFSRRPRAVVTRLLPHDSIWPGARCLAWPRQLVDGARRDRGTGTRTGAPSVVLDPQGLPLAVRGASAGLSTPCPASPRLASLRTAAWPVARDQRVMPTGEEQPRGVGEIDSDRIE
ncbi:uncharacterized protein PSFLO_04074 [Pseudozyma flocculosa]|uniref:Uncharacterized protein n=1 Tax=Pseudozyma flocculosa TaxID=84751 RepID=A0A5C3F3T3_9BASI|nr:uncharacterized protein PSFLO_04074 [Pseudozyma flocculosa]